MALTIEQIARKVDALKQRNSARDSRMSDIMNVRKGKMVEVFPTLFPDGMEHPMVGNFVDVAARDLAEVLAPLPSFNCSTTNITSDKARELADRRSLIANIYLD